MTSKRKKIEESGPPPTLDELSREKLPATNPLWSGAAKDPAREEKTRTGFSYREQLPFLSERAHTAIEADLLLIESRWHERKLICKDHLLLHRTSNYFEQYREICAVFATHLLKEGPLTEELLVWTLPAVVARAAAETGGLFLQPDMATIVLDDAISFWRSRLMRPEKTEASESPEPGSTDSAKPTDEHARRVALTNSRDKLLTDYREANPKISDYAIYQAAGRDHSCHKREFSSWRKGILKSDSATTMSLERFLRAGKPPTKKISPSP